jgi:hypothetical protein
MCDAMHVVVDVRRHHDPPSPSQTEKQRVIWGYKILFLDVLFPLELQRVIYVRARACVARSVHPLWRAVSHPRAPYTHCIALTSCLSG